MNAPRAAALAAVLLTAAPALARPREKVLIEEFEAGGVEERVRLAPALGRLKDRKAVDALLRALDVKGSNPRETAAVVAALGEAGDPLAAPALVASEEYLDSLAAQIGALPAHLQVLRVSILEAATRSGGDGAAALATKSLGDKDPRMVEEAARGLGRLQAKDAVPSLEKLSAAGGDLAQAAYEALGAIGDKSAAPTLEKALESPDPFVPVEAAYALVELGRKDMAQRLRAAVKEDPNAEKAGILAAYYLAKLDDSAGLDYLVGLMKKANSASAAMAAEALGKSGNPRAVLPLVEAAGSEESSLRVSVARALGRFSAPRSVAALKKLKDDPNPSVRGAAALSLSGLGETD